MEQIDILQVKQAVDDAKSGWLTYWQAHTKYDISPSRIHGQIKGEHLGSATISYLIKC